MNEETSQPVAHNNTLKVLVACVAVATIAVSGWFIWQQIPETLGHSGPHQPGREERALSHEHVSSPGSVYPAFNQSEASIPVDQIVYGGPPKDGIPALTNATFIAASEAAYLTPEDRLIGFTASGEAKAYPLRILDRHEAVNDRLGEESFAVTYCPLCDSAAVFDRMYKGQEYEFGISGLLYNSNALLYDRAPEGKESLWSQMASSGVLGVKNGQLLRRLPLEVTTWEDWSSRYPDTLVLSDVTGHVRSYESRPYQKYFDNPKLMFPVQPLDERLPIKANVLGVLAQGTQRAYPLASFAAGQRAQIEDELAGRKITLTYDPNHKSLRVEHAEEGVEWMYSFWFAWAAFYPDTEIYQAQ